VALYSATAEEKYLSEAIKAAEWISKNRSLPGGGFKHDEVDHAGPYMGDTIAMGRAFLSLYTATGERKWLAQAEQAAKFITENFRSSDKNKRVLGFASTAISTTNKPLPQRDENIAMVRFTNLLFHYTGNQTYREQAEHAMRYLSIPEIAQKRPPAGVVLADIELNSDPTHITIVGGKNDTQALALLKAALAYPTGYKRIEWWDKKEGKLPNQDVEYPELNTAAAFACASKRCSLPAFKPEEISARVDLLNKQKL
jgi:hypothetical protein